MASNQDEGITPKQFGIEVDGRVIINGPAPNPNAPFYDPTKRIPIASRDEFQFLKEQARRQ